MVVVVVGVEVCCCAPKPPNADFCCSADLSPTIVGAPVAAVVMAGVVDCPKVLVEGGLPNPNPPVEGPVLWPNPPVLGVPVPNPNGAGLFSVVCCCCCWGCGAPNGVVEVFAPKAPKADFEAGVVLVLVSAGLLPKPKPVVVVVVPVLVAGVVAGVDEPPKAEGVDEVLAPKVPNVFCGTGVVLPDPAGATISHPSLNE